MRTLLRLSFFYFILSCSVFSTANAQVFSREKMEFGFGVGPMIFLGDLGGNTGVGDMFLKDVNFSQSKIVKGAYGTIHLTDWLGVRAAVNAGKLVGYDNAIPDKGGPERSRKDRNLQFQSSLLEGYLGIEIYPTVLMERYDGLQGKFRPYGIAGAGFFHFNPKGQYFAPDGSVKWVELQPLRLEGQGMKEYPDRKMYSLTQLEIPLGIGFKYFLKENFYMGIEVLHRKTFTDYIDDVSTDYIDNNLFATYLTPQQAAMANQLYYRENFGTGSSMTRPAVGTQRGNPKQNDSFFSTTLRFGWRFMDWDSPYGRQARQSNCPSLF